jgi:outer membrane lipoprotein-sorting protein
VRRVGLACVAAVVAACAQAEPLAAAELMRELANVPASEVRFTETRTSAMLKAPLVVSGRLVYRRPDRLEKHVERPFAETTIIERSRVTVTRADTSRTSAVPAGAPQALVESLRATLAGDLAALERHFNVHVAGETREWTLTLVPRDAELSRTVSRVEISGSASALRRIDVLEASGDRTQTLLDAPPR